MTQSGRSLFRSSIWFKVFILSAFSLSLVPDVAAQDSFASSQDDTRASSQDDTRYNSSAPDAGDVFIYQGAPPVLQGMTNGAFKAVNGDRMPRDQYDKLVSMPDPRVLLGASLCDLTMRDLAAEEEIAPANFPPMPNALVLPANFNVANVHLPVGEEFGAPVGNFARWNLGSTAYVVRRRVSGTPVPIDGDDDIYIEKDLMERILDVGAKCGANVDYGNRVSALGLKYAHPECRDVVAPDYLIEVQSTLDRPEIAELKRTLSFRENVAREPASSLNPAQRAELAAKYESENRPFDALEERLCVVDANNDGTSRYYLARLYFSINERKLAYETLKEALESNWKKSERPVLQASYNLFGNILLMASRSAERNGLHDLSLLRLRNASVAFRRAVILNPSDENAVDGLLKVAKQAIAANPCFDNYLLLGSAQMLFGDIEKAELSYAQCALLSANDPRLKQARQFKKQLKNKPVLPLHASAAKPSA